jgi:16S rRNA (uracil1498-N3)-methyltransferase
MHRFYVSSQDISVDKIIIRDISAVHHIKDVLRLKAKDRVIVFDETANEYTADIERISPQGISLKIKERRKLTASRKFKITVACAIPKRAKMDDIIDKLTQLGVERIIPLKTSRVVIQWDKPKEIRHQRRWKTIAQNASEQCQRNTFPIVDAIRNIGKVLADSDSFDLKLIPTLVGKLRSLKEIFLNTCPRNILVLIGPEGDFTPEEVDLALKTGFIPVTLGELVLRIDTAAVAVTSFIRLYADH